MAEQAAQLFATVIALPEAKLQTDAVLSSVYIFTSFASDEELLQFAILQDRTIVLTPKGFAPSPEVQAGGGRNNFRFEGTIDVKIWNRLYIDQAGRDGQWLSNATLGVAALIHSVVDSLEQYYPTDSSGNYYFTEPMRLLPPGVVFPPKRVGEWGVVTLSYSIHWQESLT